MAEAVEKYERLVDDIPTEEPEGKALASALAAYRAQAMPNLRTLAEVNAEIASECREYHHRISRADGQAPSWNGMTQGWVDRMNALCAEPTAPEGPCACESSGLPRGGPGHPERCHGCPKRSAGP